MGRELKNNAHVEIYYPLGQYVSIFNQAEMYVILKCASTHTLVQNQRMEIGQQETKNMRKYKKKWESLYKMRASETRTEQLLQQYRHNLAIITKLLSGHCPIRTPKQNMGI